MQSLLQRALTVIKAAVPPAQGEGVAVARLSDRTLSDAISRQELDTLGNAVLGRAVHGTSQDL